MCDELCKIGSETMAQANALSLELKAADFAELPREGEVR